MRLPYPRHGPRLGAGAAPMALWVGLALACSGEIGSGTTAGVAPDAAAGLRDASTVVSADAGHGALADAGETAATDTGLGVPDTGAGPIDECDSTSDAVCPSPGGTGAFIEADGLVIIEAERGYQESGSWARVTEGDTTYLVAGSNHLNNTNGQTLDFPIRVSSPGVYRLHMKSAFSGSEPTEENDTWFKVDNTADVHFFTVEGGALNGTQQLLDLFSGASTGKTLHYPAGNAAGRPNFGSENPGRDGFFKIYRSGGGGNKWDARTIDNHGYPVYAYFPSAGDYVVQMSERSAGHRVDRFALAHIDDVGAGVPTAALEGPESSRAGASSEPAYSCAMVGGLYGQTRTWLERSAQAGHPWFVTATEASGNQAPTPNTAVTPRQRIYWMWANVMAGGGGFEWYLKNDGAGHAYDLAVEDQREFDAHWTQTGHLVRFFNRIVQDESVSLPALQPDNDATSTTSDWVLSDAGAAYIIFLRQGGSTDLTTTGAGTYRVSWFNPRTGQLIDEAAINAGATVSVGPPPTEVDQDWVVFVRR